MPDPQTQYREQEILNRVFNDKSNSLRTSDFFLQVALGFVPGFSFVHKFGRNTAVGTSLVPVCDGGNYQTPSSAEALEILSSSTDDTNSSGSGARQVFVQGLASDGSLQSETVNLNGTTAVDLANSYLRVFRAYVVTSGSYATQSTPSQVGTITLRADGGGVTWLTIPEVSSGFGGGQSLCGAYTVPLEHTAYILSQEFNSDVSGTKTTDFYFFKRENILDTTAPYSGTMRVQNAKEGTQDGREFEHKTYESYPELTDIGFLSKATTTTKASVEFELLLVDNNYLMD